MISPTARPAGDPTRAWGALARSLARAIPATPQRLAEVEATGRNIGRPEPGRVHCTLGNCRYRDSVVENQPVICGLHRGLVRGLLDRVAPDATLERFIPHDPYTAGCEIEIADLAPTYG